MKRLRCIDVVTINGANKTIVIYSERPLKYFKGTHSDGKLFFKRLLVTGLKYFENL